MVEWMVVDWIVIGAYVVWSRLEMYRIVRSTHESMAPDLLLVASADLSALLRLTLHSVACSVIRRRLPNAYGVEKVFQVVERSAMVDVLSLTLKT